MLISYEWLQDFVQAKKVSPKDIASKLTMSTVEVEGIVDQAAQLGGVVVGEILDIKKHPDADKLSVAQVDVGEKTPRQIIFGQMVDMEAGLKVPVALAPTVLPGDKEIKKVKMRGVVSEGMLCLDQELGLLDEGVSIQFFDASVKNGTPIVKALSLGGVVFDIDNKSLSNRPDLWGHYGIAREVAALFDTSLAAYKTTRIKEGKDTLKVKIQDDRCRRYTGIVIDGVSVTSSPDWMQQRLIAAGVRPINLVVDITNYVMLEFGQPMHAFDAAKLDGDIHIRAAKKGETLAALGDKECALDGDLIIADSKKPIAVAGVIGGANSDIDDSTTTIIFESANFEGISVRRTSNRLGIRTESSTRFEKQLDPTMCVTALERAVALLLDACPDARVTSKIADEGSAMLDQGPIMLSETLVEKKVGINIPQKDIVSILMRLGFEVKEKKGEMQVTIPTWRATGDVDIAEDLIEEIIRLYGYEKIPTSFPTFSITPPTQRPIRRVTRRIKETLAFECGFFEVYNYSFESPEWLARIGISPKKHIELENPVAKDRPIVRRSMEPNLLMNVEQNSHRFNRVALFEVGKTYVFEEKGELVEPKKKEYLPKQNTMLGLVVSEKGNEQPFFDASQALSLLGTRIGAAFKLVKSNPSEAYYHPGRFAQVKVGKNIVGEIGELHPMTQQTLGIPHRVAVASINLSELTPLLEESSSYRSLSQYPDVQRDVAFVVDRDVEHVTIVDELDGADPLLVSAELFDVYDGDKMEKGKKSMAYRCTYRHADKTLETKEVDDAHATVVALLEKKFDATIRK